MEVLQPDPLDRALPNPDLKDFNGPLVDDLLTNTIHSSTDLGSDELKNHWNLTRKLFGSDFHREYPWTPNQNE